MPIVYHQATLDLLGKAPRTSVAAVRLLDERGAALGVNFPASVREWYALQGAERVLADHGGDRPVALKALGESREVGLGWLRILDECQGVAAWYVRLDGSDDPPVYLHTEMASTPEDEARVRDADDGAIDFLVDFPHWWSPAAPSFSAFVHGRVVTYGGDAESRAAVAALQDAALPHRHSVRLDDRGRIVQVSLGVSCRSGPGHPEPPPQLPGHLFALLRGQAHLRELSIGPWEVGPEGWAALRGHPALEGLDFGGESYRPGTIETLLDLPALRSLALSDVPLADDELVRLLEGLRLVKFDFTLPKSYRRGLAALANQVDLEEASFEVRSDDDLAGLRDLARLKYLTVGGPGLTNAGLAHLAGLRTLEYLSISSPKITDAGLSHLSGLTSLERLHLPWSKRIRGEGLRSLAGMSELRELDLGTAPIGDASARHLAPLTSLRRLTVRSPNLTDAGLVPISGLENLERLELIEAAITDSGLTHLAPLRHLRHLELVDVAGVTPAGIGALRRALPGLDARIQN